MILEERAHEYGSYENDKPRTRDGPSDHQQHPAGRAQGDEDYAGGAEARHRHPAPLLPRGPAHQGALPPLLGRGRRQAPPARRLLDGGLGRHGGPHGHADRPRHAGGHPAAHARQPPQGLPLLPAQPELRPAAPLQPLQHPALLAAVRLQGGAAHRDESRHRARPVKVHPLRPLHPRLQGRAGHCSADVRRAQQRHRRHDGLQQADGDDGLHPLRPVQPRLPDGRARREGRHGEGPRRAAGPEEARHRAGRAVGARLPGRCLRHGAGRHRHGTDGHGPASPRLRQSLRHELRRGSHDHGGRHRVPRPPATWRRAADDDLVLPGLGLLRREALQ